LLAGELGRDVVAVSVRDPELDLQVQLPEASFSESQLLISYVDFVLSL
jgi:hypothetical protein